MNGSEAFLYFFMDGAMLALTALGLESAIVTPSLKRWDKRFFIAYFTVLLLCFADLLIELVIFVGSMPASLLAVTYFFDSLLCVVPFPLLTIYLLHCCGEDWRSSSLFRVMLALWTVYFILVVVSQFTTYFYYVDSNSQLQLGPGYNLGVALVLAMLLLLAAGVIRRYDKLSRQYRRAFLVSLFPVTIALIIHVVVPVFSLIALGLALSAYAMNRIIEHDSIEQGLRQQREIANQRASIAVLQMRPHFIYNTMTSIYYLCDQDPKLAKQVTMDFTTYLRKNFTAIASEDPISFADELEHTRAYLAVEQAQFEDGLLVDYDTPHTRFRVPPLTLQPIVENAVKHGMDPDSESLCIQIHTRKTDSGSQIIVEDNGSGFEPANDGEPHIGLANIEQRLDVMCGGWLDIAPREGGGTVVRVTIPG